MSKVTPEELKRGWNEAAFSMNAADFDAFLDAVIAEASGELSGRLGSVYDGGTGITAVRIKKAEAELCQEQLWAERERVLSQQAATGGEGTGSKFAVSTERRAADGARERAEEFIRLILDGGLSTELVATGGAVSTGKPGDWGIETCST